LEEVVFLVTSSPEAATIDARMRSGEAWRGALIAATR